MDSVATLDEQERRLLFNETAARMGFAPWVAEKDFWVCWVLKALFTVPDSHPRLLFKGGTSLSKVFAVIERFSEDVDLSVNREDLGFVGNRDPEVLSGNARHRMLRELDQAAVDFVRSELQPRLHDRFAQVLGDDGSWRIQGSQGGPNLVFEYPPATETLRVGYVSQTILIEIGARSDHGPAGDHAISPYAHEHFPEYFTDPTCTVTVMDATFWEKATILHAVCHGGAEKVRARLSRHYYDLQRLSETSIGVAARGNAELLERVRIHKSVYFPSGWARYDEAKPGSLRLVPGDDVVQALRRDFEEMARAGYFYGEDPPSFKQIIDGLGTLEARINRS